jgi:hypothetical protein
MYHRTLKAKLHDVHDFILRSMGEKSTTIFLCAKALWLRQAGRAVCVSKSEDSVVLDLSQIPLKPEDSLDGVWFSIIGVDGRETDRGQVKHTPEQACIKLCKLEGVPRVGDLAIPIEPPEATDLERLLGNVLFIVSE